MRIATALCALLLAVAPAAAGQQEPPADFTARGTITGADHQHYREVPFDVPAGVERITVLLHYDRTDKTVIDLGVWDPQGFRGWSGGTRDRFTIAASDASPGYLPGRIPAGRWKVLLGVPNARKGSNSAYSVEIRFDRAGKTNASRVIAEPPLNPNPGWYRGDLHMHDANSDGSCATQSGTKRVPCPLFRTTEAAAARGLDFVAVTDHNTVAHFDDLRELQPFYDRMLLIPGVEITTFGGHANIFGPSRFVDFRVGTPAVPDVRALQHAVAASGAIMSLNHPALPSGEACMGCGWIWPNTDYGLVTAIEAVNSSNAEGPLAGIGFWYARLDEGHRLTGIGGSDSHDPDAAAKPIGKPTTVVHARELSLDGIRDGIRAGNVFIDVEGTRDRLLELEVASGNAHAVMGGALTPQGPIQLDLHLVGVAGASVELVANGKPLADKAAIIPSSDARLSLTLDDPARACGWIAANVRRDGHPLLIGNPVYITCR